MVRASRRRGLFWIATASATSAWSGSLPFHAVLGVSTGWLHASWVIASIRLLAKSAAVVMSGCGSRLAQLVSRSEGRSMRTCCVSRRGDSDRGMNIGVVQFKHANAISPRVGRRMKGALCWTQTWRMVMWRSGGAAHPHGPGGADLVCMCTCGTKS